MKGSTRKLAKVIADAGLCSRRRAEQLILGGRVSVDGAVVREPKVRPGRGALVAVDSRPVPLSPKGEAALWRYYKPAGVIVSRKDPSGRPTVFDRLPSSMRMLKTVGRLDQYSEGLLLLTSDGGLVERLTHPRYEVPRVYHVRVFGLITPGLLSSIAHKSGHVIGGVRYRIQGARLVGRARGSRCSVSHALGNAWLQIVLKEGKNREVRRVLEHFGLGVSRLVRVAFGPFRLGCLGRGEYAPEPVPDVSSLHDLVSVRPF